MKRRTFVTASALSIAGLSGCIADTEYRIAETTARTGIDLLDFSVRTEVPDATIKHPAEFVFELENTGNDPVGIKNYGVWPFGLIAVHQSPDADTSIAPGKLSSQSYETSDRVDVKPTGMGLDGTPITQTLEPGERVHETYQLHGEEIRGEGTYYVVPYFDDNLPSYAIDGDWTTFEFQCEIRIEAIERLPL
ncbi:hypothetical protein C453_00730 [Haloferax elongans ATCC BAA-1513]|uniref:DUF8130 domain-containing protein n=1 Tax=Haloferax elongans ATCC BAA-1513 TaxID=1230453 RepID=M0HZ43_HALEO|nr:hypothetical protein [Haloferax elongans]ELZ88988.1 hypothetical protein C453_00730 [Haloferax elongans ATCC BAA-1513]